MASAKKTDIMKLDLYKLFNVPEDATPKQIKKGYRIKALECHPDKNPDNPKAAELFNQLSEALKILSDIGARAAYDHLRKAKKAAQERNEKLSSERKKVKLDLEARERAAEEIERKHAKRTMKQEIERLREQGSRILEEEQRRMREEMLAEKLSAESAINRPSAPVRLKLRWKSSKDDESNGGYSEKLLNKMLSKYGQISALLLSKKKNGTAVVEFQDANSARLAVEMELGIPSNPLKVSWLSGQPFPDRTTSSDIKTNTFSPQDGDKRTSSDIPRTGSSAPPCDDDFEAAVLKNLRREQERRRVLARDLEQDVEE